MKINEKQKNLSLYHKCRRPGDMAMKALIYLSVTITVGFLLILLFFVLSNGLPAIIQNPDFLWTEYNLSAKLTGILPMVINTIHCSPHWNCKRHIFNTICSSGQACPCHPFYYGNPCGYSFRYFWRIWLCSVCQRL